jgi:hypothetical protein
MPLVSEIRHADDAADGLGLRVPIIQNYPDVSGQDPIMGSIINPLNVHHGR